MINPVNHATSAEEAARGRAEPTSWPLTSMPYRRIPACGGWTCLVHRLGRLDVSADRGIPPRLKVTNCGVEGFKIHYRYRETVYHIAVLQTPAENGEMRVTVDGVEQHDKTIPLVDGTTNNMYPAARGRCTPIGALRTTPSVGQIYLYDNALLKQPLKLEHIKRWFSATRHHSGLNFIYVHLNRVIKKHGLKVMLTSPAGATAGGAGGERLSW